MNTGVKLEAPRAGMLLAFCNFLHPHSLSEKALLKLKGHSWLVSEKAGD